MDIIAFNEAATANERIEKIVANPDSVAGLVSVPNLVPTGETITIPAGRTVVHPNLQIDGTLDIQGDLFIPSGGTMTATSVDVDEFSINGDKVHATTISIPSSQMLLGDVSFNASSISIANRVMQFSKGVIDGSFKNSSEVAVSETPVPTNGYVDGVNYLYKTEGGSWYSTVNEPTFGVASTTGHYFLDGNWYTSSNVLVSPTITYLPKKVLVASGDIVTVDDFKYPSLVQKYVKADKVECTEFKHNGIDVGGFIGVGQTWQNVSGSRASGVTYTNTTGKPIQILVNSYATVSGNNGVVVFNISGMVFYAHHMSGSADANFEAVATSLIIPNGATYLVTITAGSVINIWLELR